MLHVGLTGGVAAGKSRVAQGLAGLGAAVIDADEVVAKLYRPQGAGTAVVVSEFGTGVLAADGSVDRKKLATAVLAHPPARRRLEELVHPLVRAAVTAWLREIGGGAAVPPVAVVEAALLVESGSWREYHRLVVVEAPLALRRVRALAAGWTEAAFDAVVQAQVNDEARRAVAHYVVINDREEKTLQERILQLWQALVEDEKDRRVGRPWRKGVRVLA